MQFDGEDSTDHDVMQYAFSIGAKESVEILKASTRTKKLSSDPGVSGRESERDSHCMTKDEEYFDKATTQTAGEAISHLDEARRKLCDRTRRLPDVVIKGRMVSACRVCDLETWMEGSKHQLQYTMSLRRLRSAASECPLCGWLAPMIADESDIDQERQQGALGPDEADAEF